MSDKTIILRPRFRNHVQHPKAKLLEAFIQAKENQKNYSITVLDDHVFIKFSQQLQHYWSPQLHLECVEIDHKNTMLHGLFGPKPTVWTLFMFLHFVIAVFFIAFGIWAYTNWTLGNSYAVQIFLVLSSLLMWFLLYAAGRIGRAKGKPEMHQLHDFMTATLKAYF